MIFPPACSFINTSKTDSLWPSPCVGILISDPSIIIGRETYEAALRCRKEQCGQSGLARWKEPEHFVWHGEQPHILLSVPEGFARSEKGVIACEKMWDCGLALI